MYNGKVDGFVGAFTIDGTSELVPILKWARFELGPKNIVSGLVSGYNDMFTVDISLLSPVTSRFFKLTLVGDDGIVVDPANIFHWTVNSGITEIVYPSFEIQPINNTSVLIRQILFFGGVYDNYNSYFQTYATNWDGVLTNRGYLDVFYTES